MNTYIHGLYWIYIFNTSRYKDISYDYDFEKMGCAKDFRRPEVCADAIA